MPSRAWRPYCLGKDATGAVGGRVAGGAIIAEDQARGEVAHGYVAVVGDLIDGEDPPREVFDVFRSGHMCLLVRRIRTLSL